MKKKILICGSGGFIGSHLVKLLNREGYCVSGVDINTHEYAKYLADDSIQGVLRDPRFMK